MRFFLFVICFLSTSSLFLTQAAKVKKISKRADISTPLRVRETVPLTNLELDKLTEELLKIEDVCTKSEECASKWLSKYNFVLGKIYEKNSLLGFNYAVNITDENSKALNDFSTYANNFLYLTKLNATKFLQNYGNWSSDLKRQIQFITIGIVFKDKVEANKLSELINTQESIYAKAKVCNETACLSLEPELEKIMENSRDYDKLLWAWKGWHEASGAKMRKTFAETVRIQNKGAVENNYTDLSQNWLEDYEEADFEQKMDNLFNKIKPLYEQLHGYVRRKLKNIYGSKYPLLHDPRYIPAHILGNMWAQSWEGIYDLVVPFPNARQTDLTDLLVKKNFTPVQIYKEAEKFFVSIGLFNMTPTFWKYSMLEKPQNRSVQCHAAAYDIFNGFDYRIKCCTLVDDSYFYVAHHEMGHTQYQMAYSNQPSVFRNGANSGFHEAIGDTIALSVLTPVHFKKIGLTDDDSMTYEQEINFLMKLALKKLATLPWSYLVDKWRFQVFRGKITEENYNQKWWEMRKIYQGVEPPVPRSENDFDPGAKYHVAAYVPYSRYFVSNFLQFQFFKSLCDYSGHTGALFRCDFYNSKEAGSKLKEMLEVGSSKHWSQTLKQMTKESSISADAIFEYFKPLEEWLKMENAKYPLDVPGF